MSSPNISQLTMTTAEVARLVGVTPDAVTASVRRTGAFRGCRPRKMPDSGAWSWSVVEVRKMIGTPLPEPGLAWTLAGRVLRAVPGADLGDLVKACADLYTGRGWGPAGERVAELREDLETAPYLAEAFARRVFWALSDEAEMKPEDWAAVRRAADTLEQAARDLRMAATWEPIGGAA